jgi:pimeloyl-ACP methyl ester carboxylesterase
MLLPPHKVKDVVEWLGSPKVVGLGPSGHFPQEEHPHRIGEEIRVFLDNILEA